MEREKILEVLKKEVACNHTDFDTCMKHGCSNCPNGYPESLIEAIEGAIKLIEKGEKRCISVIFAMKWDAWIAKTAISEILVSDVQITMSGLIHASRTEHVGEKWRKKNERKRICLTNIR